jgi:hypothetical protein
MGFSTDPKIPSEHFTITLEICTFAGFAKQPLVSTFLLNHPFQGNILVAVSSLLSLVVKLQLCAT